MSSLRSSALQFVVLKKPVFFSVWYFSTSSSPPQARPRNFVNVCKLYFVLFCKAYKGSRKAPYKLHALLGLLLAKETYYLLLLPLLLCYLSSHYVIALISTINIYFPVYYFQVGLVAFKVTYCLSSSTGSTLTCVPGSKLETRQRGPK